MATSFLLSGPLEVLLQITAYLSTSDYCSLRSTCKGVEEVLFTNFALEFFQKRKFMFTEFSLQALIDISKSRFSTYLTHVIFGLERPPSGMQTPIAPILNSPGTNDMQIRFNHLRWEYIHHCDLISNSQEIEMLAEAFSNLESLQIVGIRDFDSPTRHRDEPPNNVWRSYGASTFKRNTGVALFTPQSRHDANVDYRNGQILYSSRIFSSVLRALGQANSKPKNLEVILRQSALTDQSFSIPKWTESKISPVLRHLNTAFLDLNLESSSMFVEGDNGKATECPAFLLRGFLHRISQVEHLRLNFAFSSLEGHATDFLAWLAMPYTTIMPSTSADIPLPRPPPPVDFHSLRQLELGSLQTNTTTLLAVLRKFKCSLRSLSLHRVTLVAHALAQARDKENIWIGFFNEIADLNFTLSVISLSNISQRYLGTGPFYITFLNRSSHSMVRPTMMTWRGSDFSRDVKEVTEAMFIHWPQVLSYSSETDSAFDSDVEVMDEEGESSEDS
ncbi:hypothetical protein B0O99DRAFT_605452 [Bisporella sp. PMI_857]|nr:hypothetical protein B0O99DRAFT_605452 [Bisporella sp. PMI_857]